MTWTLDINLNVKHPTLPASAEIEELKERTTRLMASIDEIKARLIETISVVKTNNDLISGLDVLIQGISDQLAAALKAAGATDEVLAAATDVLSAVNQQKELIVAAANVNTPQETPEDAQIVSDAKL